MTKFLRRRVGLTAWGWWVALFVTLALLGAASAGLARAQTAPDEVPRYTPSARGTRPAVTRWRPLLEQYDWNVERALRVIDCESGGNPLAANPRSDARGLWQLLGWEHLAHRLHGVWSVMNPYVATDVAYQLWLWGGRRFGTPIGWAASAVCWDTD